MLRSRVHREQVLGPPLRMDRVTTAKALGERPLDRAPMVEDQAWMPFSDPRLMEHLLPCMQALQENKMTKFAGLVLEDVSTVRSQMWILSAAGDG